MTLRDLDKVTIPVSITIYEHKYDPELEDLLTIDLFEGAAEDIPEKLKDRYVLRIMPGLYDNDFGKLLIKVAINM